MKELTFVDLFAGAGGFGLGFQMAKFKPILSVEKDKWACKTLIYNNDHFILNKDITELNTPAKVKYACKQNMPDIIIGGPPCQGFSVAGANRVKDREVKNNLFRNYLDWVKILKPKLFIIENVPGIITQKIEGEVKVIDVIKELSSDIGFHITIWKLNALNYGVPQSRERVFIIGTRENIELSIPEPTHNLFNNNELSFFNTLSPAVTVGEAILDLPVIHAREGVEVTDYTNKALSDFQKWARKGSKMVHNHVAMNHTERIVKRYKMILDGVDEMPDELRVRMRSGGGQFSKVKFNQNYRHLSSTQISFTIPASFYSSFIHPNLPRNITTREAARLQSFPDSYVFKGKRTIVSNSLLKRLGKDSEINLSQYNQVGNAVPPLLAMAVAKRIRKYLIHNK